MSEVQKVPLAGNLRRLRRQNGLSVVELARRAGTSRATLTQIEAGGGNPTLDTLYALATALDAGLAELITEPDAVAPPRVVPRGEGTRVVGEAVEAWLLHTTAHRAASTEIYDFRLHGAAAQHSPGHPRGTHEHLHLHSGRIRIGPVGATVEIGAGDFATFDAGREHLYQRVGDQPVRGLLVITRAQP
ncbi:helix-turn-helix domain-containing protein [Saccharopolyspora gregorii]|uniref:helix-turn-helix domain-containing protein n=1 Tax=Saccharopolyspora gregorii TaxID=33914 RepID=UPI0021AC81CE|nr:XRE family transcriptional regulator [Saccharopolyspora gregorii]